MIVDRIEWLSKEAQEALVYISDGRYEVAAFCQPCNLNTGENIQAPLLAISIGDIAKEESCQTLFVRRMDKGFSCEIVAKILDKNKNLLGLGSILIELDEPLPGDLFNDDVVRFVCGRIDLIG